MTQDNNDALKRFISKATRKRAEHEDAADVAAVAAVASSIFGGVQHFSGNVIFMGEAAPGTIEKVLSKNSRPPRRSS